jgi:putative aldouronate transport system permease protein
MMDVINRSALMTTVSQGASYGMGASAITTTTTSLQMAAMVIAVFPILAVYPFLQRYFVKGVMIGSVKE